MKVKSKIQKWGNGLGLRVSGPLRDIPHFFENIIVEVDINETGFTVKRLEESSEYKTELPFSEAELLKGITAKNVHSDILINPLSGEF